MWRRFLRIRNPLPSQISSHLNKAPMKIQSMFLFVGSGSDRQHEHWLFTFKDAPSQHQAHWGAESPKEDAFQTSIACLHRGHLWAFLLKSESYLIFFYFKAFYLFIFRGERREKARERNISVWLPLTYPYWGPGWKPRLVPWLGIKPMTLWFTGWRWIHWATPARAWFFKFCFLLVFSSTSDSKHQVVPLWWWWFLTKGRNNFNWKHSIH